MKKVKFIKTAVITFLLVFPMMAMGQTVTQEFETGTFTGVSAGGVYTVSITQADDYAVKIETTEDQMEKVSVEVSNNVLTLGYDSRLFERTDRIKVSITAPAFEKIIAGGAASISSENTLSSPAMEITASGASNVKLQLETDKLTSKVSGASNATLEGTAKTHKTEVSGAASLKAYELQTEVAEAKGSGASSLQVNASKNLNAEASGTSSINWKQVPENQRFKTSGTASINFKGDPEDLDDETTTLENDREIIKIRDDKDTVSVAIGDTDLMVISDDKNNDVDVKTEKRTRSFRSNWSGVELGVNGFLTPDHSITLNDEKEFLEVDYARAISVNFNLFQQNFNIIRNNVGLVTGFGFNWNNYAFENEITLVHERDELDYIEEDRGFKRNRLTQVHFNVPLLLEFQTARTRKIEQFHLAAGVIGRARMGSYTRQVYDFHGDKHKEKLKKSYHTRPFKLDATARIGWGRVNLFASYGLHPLFYSDKAPELHPFNIGISLTNW